MNNELVFNLREKAQTETYPAYVDSIKKDIENFVNTVNNNNANAREITSKVSALEAENAELRSLVESLKQEKISLEEKATKSSMYDDELKNSIREINDKVTVNSSSEKLDEILNRLIDIEAAIASKKEDVISDYNARTGQNMEDNFTPDVNLMGNQEDVPSFDNSADTIAPSSDVIDSIAPQAPVEETQQEISPSIEEEKTEEVVSTEEAPTETVAAAQQVINLEAAKKRALRAGLTYLHGKSINDVRNDVVFDPSGSAEYSDEHKETFKSLVSLEQNIAKAR